LTGTGQIRNHLNWGSYPRDHNCWTSL